MGWVQKLRESHEVLDQVQHRPIRTPYIVELNPKDQWLEHFSIVHGERLEYIFLLLEELVKEIPFLSSLLIILYMENMAQLVQIEVSSWNWLGIKASKKGPTFLGKWQKKFPKNQKDYENLLQVIGTKTLPT